MARVHLDEARRHALTILDETLEREPAVEQMVVLDDLFGRLRVCIWTRDAVDALRIEVAGRLSRDCGPFWNSADLHFRYQADEAEGAFWEDVWREAADWSNPATGRRNPRLKVNDRHRNRTAWFLPITAQAPVWSPAEGPPIVVFYSFKGGVGRTTALASYAIARARRGERLAVVDCDLDAPGIGRLLDADGEGAQAGWGVVDFLLEEPHALPLEDYKHACARGAVTGDGVIDVFPAGRVDADYLGKLARVDLESGQDVRRHPLARLLVRIRDELRPSVILLDGRAGLSPAAGLLLSGLAHLHVLFATNSSQSLAGLTQVVRRLGYEQARAGQPQNECIIVQAMVPANPATAELARPAFEADVEDVFRDNYYARESDEEDAVWSLRDIGSQTSPHVPVPVTYSEKLAFFRTIDEIADVLADSDDYTRLCEAVDERLARPNAETQTKEAEG